MLVAALWLLCAGQAAAATAALLGVPAGVRFEASLAETQAALKGACQTAPVRRIDPPFLDNIKDRQVQIDCEGLVFAGQPRHVEFVIGDDRLAMIWLMVKPEEEAAVVAMLAKAYGPPKAANAKFLIFPGHEVAWRRDKAEILYYGAERAGDVTPDFKPDKP
jgi:hypothetical protein